MRSVFPKIDKQLFSKVVVIDGGAVDGSLEVCAENEVEFFKQTRRGIRYGMEDYLAFDTNTCDYILTFSPDGNCNPSTLPKFVDACDGKVQLVVGSRYADGTSSNDDDFITAFGTRSFKCLTNLLVKTNFIDVFSIYRAVKPNQIRDLGLNEDESYLLFEKLLNTYHGWEPLMTFRVAKYGCTIKEVGVGEPARLGGERKLQVLKWGAGFLFQLIRETLHQPKSTRDSDLRT